MLDSFAFDGFKALFRVSVDLQPFTLVVGPNGCGKSSVLDGIHYLCQLAGGSTPDAGAVFSGPRAPARLAFPGSAKFTLGAKAQGRLFQVTIDVDQALEGRNITSTFQGHEVDGQWFDITASSLTKFQEFSSVVRLRLDAEAAKRPSAREQGGRPARVEYDGSGLATVVADALGRREPMVEAIEADLRRVVPAVRAIRAVPRDVERRKTEIVEIGGESHALDRRDVAPGHMLQLDMDGVGWVDADLLSEGTILVLALLTLLHGPRRPRLVLLDDVDRGLHPTAQAQLIARIRELQASAPDLQVVATTHSPYLVDKVEPSEIRVMAVKGGKAICKALTAHPEWSKWKESIKAGEFWGSVGEDWVTA